MHNAQPDRAIDARSLGKHFGLRWVLRGVTFGIEPGEAVGLLGPNGSGKSTVLRVLATLLRPNAGSATIMGLDIARDASAARMQVGYLAHTAGLYEDLTARENLKFAADMLCTSYRTVDETLDRVGLAKVADSRVRGFSAGMQRRLTVARLIMRRPTVLLLDEPYSNLDEEGIELVNSVIEDVVRSEGAALLALHELAPARRVLDRTLTLNDGRIASSAHDHTARDQAALVNF